MELQYLTIKSISNKECSKRLNKIKMADPITGNVIVVKKLLNKRNLCTVQKSGTDACQGDSGGPLYLEERRKKGPWVRLIGFTVLFCLELQWVCQKLKSLK